MPNLPDQNQVPLLDVKQLGRKVGNHWIWRNLDFSLHPGDRLGLSGPSGLGKTLFLRSLVGLDPPSEGLVCWQGQPFTANHIPDYRSQMILLPQRATLWEGTVEDNLKRPFQLKRQRGKVYNRETVSQLCAQIGRSEAFLERSSQHLSGGERQLVSILRILLLNPQVLLLDEPTASLDAATTLQVEALIQQWYQQELHQEESHQKSQRAYLWVSHDWTQLHRLNVKMWEMIPTFIPTSVQEA